MAARENQGLQIALIIFVMLTIVLIVTTFVFFNSYKEGQERIKTLEADNNTKSEAARQALEESSKIRGLLDPKLDKTEAVDEASKQDFEKYGKGLAEADQNYRALVEHVNKQLVAANTSITDITAQKKELADKLAAEEAATKKAIEEYTATIAKVTKDPWGNDYVFKCPGEHGTVDISSNGKDGEAGTEDDINSWDDETSDVEAEKK